VASLRSIALPGFRYLSMGLRLINGIIVNWESGFLSLATGDSTANASAQYVTIDMATGHVVSQANGPSRISTC
jgi:hypothetical protein